jgi:two-component system, cell cycle sensor histidine kinase and response regulator CckA
MGRTLRVLNIEDSEQDVALIQRHLSRVGYDVISARVETPAAMKAALDGQPWDIILCDYSMPQFNALEALKLVKERRLDIPFIIISGTVGEAVAIEAMRAGAHDYLMKDNLMRLAPAIERELHEAENRRARRLAEAALRESEDRFRDLIEHSNDLIYTHDLAGQILSFNQTAIKLLGYDQGALLKTNIRHLLFSKYQEEFDHYIAELQQRGQAQGVMAVQTSTGEKRLLEYNNTLRTEGVAVPIVRGMAKDVTEHNRAEKILQAREQRFRSLIENSSDAIALFDANGAILYASPSTPQVTGFSPEELVQFNAFELIHPDDHEFVAERLAIALNQPRLGVFLEARVRHKDGAWRWLEGMFTNLLEEPSVGAIVNNYRDITQRKRAEEALRESEERYKGLIDSAFDGVVIHQNTMIRSVNRAYAEMFGYTIEELLGRNILELTPPEHRDFVFSQFRRENSLYEAFGLKKDGTYISIEISAKNCLFEGESARLAAVRNITERKQAEEQLHHQLVFTEAITASLGEGVYALDQRGRVTFMNPAAEAALGWTQVELLGQPMHEIIRFQPPDGTSLPANDDPLLQVLHSGQAIQDGSDLFTRKDGTRFPVSYTASPIITGGQVVGSVLAFHDITERKRVEEIHLRRGAQVALRADINGALAESNSSLRDILDHCTAAMVQFLGASFARIWTLNQDEKVLELQASSGIYTHIDGAHARVPVGAFKIGRIAEERLPHITNDVQHDPRVSDKAWAEREGMIAFAGYPLLVTDKLVGVVAMFARHKLAEDTLDALASIADIISQSIERKHAEEALRKSEEQLRQAQKMEAVGRLAGGIAHDFNNLLTVITGYSQLTLRSLHAEDPLRDNIEEIKKAGDRAAALTRQLLTFSRKQVLQPKVLDLNAVVSEIEKMLRRLIGEDIELRTALQPELGHIKADPGQIEQVLMNLAVNARDAMPNGGKLTIETQNVSVDEDFVKQHIAVIPGSYVMLAVSDTGIGMNEETQQRIFEPFFTTKELGQGTGLGLSTVYGIVQQSGGGLWVYSEVGRGTTFKVYLPRVDEEAQVYKPGLPAPEALSGKETILLAEDEEIVRNLVREVLKSHGYKVLEAANGGAALLLCERHQGPIHLMITDVIMPEMSGRELTDRLAGLRPEMKVLYMSGYTDNAIADHGVLEAGKNFIQKPFSPDALVGKVREVLD